MDIQRGDQVYYRGEVWEVLAIFPDLATDGEALIERCDRLGYFHQATVSQDNFQRVEQVR